MKNELKTVEANLSVGALKIIWEKCFSEEVCVKIPFDGKKCVSASGCVRILLEDSIYKLEVELFGERKKFDLVEQCITGYTVGIASLEVCISKLKIENGQLKGVSITARLCIGTKIGGIKVEKCWNVITTDINFFHFAEYSVAAGFSSSRMDEAFETAKAANADFLYTESD